jgi:hypothetical protein
MGDLTRINAVLEISGTGRLVMRRRSTTRLLRLPEAGTGNTNGNPNPDYLLRIIALGRWLLPLLMSRLSHYKRAVRRQIGLASTCSHSSRLHHLPSTSTDLLPTAPGTSALSHGLLRLASQLFPLIPSPRDTE